MTNVATPPQALSPTFESKPPLTLIGLQRHYQCTDKSGIAEQWAAFVPLIEQIVGRASTVAYGVCMNTLETEFDYFCGVEARDRSAPPQGVTTLFIPEQNYAIFKHHGRVECIADTVHRIFAEWMPHSNYVTTGQPTLVERYSEDFEPVSNTGDVEIWIPIEPVR